MCTMYSCDQHALMYCCTSLDPHTFVLGVPEFPVEKVITKHCCNRKIITCFEQLSQADIENTRWKFYSYASETEQTQHIIDYMMQHSRGDKKVTYTIAGQQVCETAYRLAYGIRKTRFFSMRAKFNDGVVVVEHGLYKKSCFTDSTIRAVSWLRTFIAKVGDGLPTKNEVHLPSCLTKSDVYSLACDDLSQGGLEPCKLSTFYEIWRANFTNVKIPKVCMYKRYSTPRLASKPPNEN